MSTYKIHIKLVRSFSVGFTILSPTYNGLCVHLHLTCFHICLSSRGDQWFGATSYWGGYE